MEKIYNINNSGTQTVKGKVVKGSTIKAIKKGK